jgi:hypothetical protein
MVFTEKFAGKGRVKLAGSLLKGKVLGTNSVTMGFATMTV